MMRIVLAVFAVAMLLASVRHLLAFFRRERVLKEMHSALAAAGRIKNATNVAQQPRATAITAEQPLSRGVLVGPPPELRRENETTEPGKRRIRSLAV